MVEAEYNLAPQRDDLIQNQEAFQVKSTDLYLLYITNTVSPPSLTTNHSSVRTGKKCS